MRRLAVVTSHPIQYQAPWFRALAKVTDLEVFFCHRQDPAGQAAAGFGVEFEWDVPLLDGYSHRWLENRAARPGVSHFFGCDTPEIADVIHGGSFDACLVCGWYLKSYLQAIRSCRREGVPVMSRGDSQLATARSRAWTVAKYVPYRWLLGTLDAHLYVGEANRAYLAHYGVARAKLFFAPHFVDNEFFASRAAGAREHGDADAVRSAHGIPHGATLFVFVGKLIERKRPADLVRALASARQAGSAAWALFVGSGPLEAELEALARDLDAPVRFAGFKNQTELPAYLAAADGIVLPSDSSETWGLVVNEAMACGLPAVVSSDVGCRPDLIDESATGYSFPTGDVAALARALTLLERQLRADPRSMREAVAKKIAAYSCDRAVAGTLAALEAVVHHPTTERTTADPAAGAFASSSSRQ